MAFFKKGWEKTAVRRWLSPKSTISLVFALIVFGYLGFLAFILGAFLANPEQVISSENQTEH